MEKCPARQTVPQMGPPAGYPAALALLLGMAGITLLLLYPRPFVRSSNPHRPSGAGCSGKWEAGGSFASGDILSAPTADLPETLGNRPGALGTGRLVLLAFGRAFRLGLAPRAVAHKGHHAAIPARGIRAPAGVARVMSAPPRMRPGPARASWRGSAPGKSSPPRGAGAGTGGEAGACAFD